MAKNILIFSDGTGQAGGVRPDQRLSNVYKLYRAIRTGPDSPIDPASQIAFYDAGLGTDDDAGPALLRGLTYNLRADPKFAHYYAAPAPAEPPQDSGPDRLAG